MKKKITALLAAGVLLLQCTPLSAFADVIEVSPGNSVYLDVVNAAGNSVKNVEVTLYNSLGTEIGGIRNDAYFFESNDSGIDGTKLKKKYSFDVPWDTFIPYAAPQTLHSVRIGLIDENNVYEIPHSNEPSRVFSGTPYKAELFCYDESQATALTVPANQFGVYVDPKWENRTIAVSITTPSVTRYINYTPNTGIFADAFVLQPGTTNVIEAFDVNYTSEVKLIWPSQTSSSPTSAAKVSTAATEYILCRLPLQQLCHFFREDGKFELDGLLYDLQQDTEYTSAILTIQSGAVINIVIPDDNGYVEFYLDRATREYALDYCLGYNDVPTEDGMIKSGGWSFSRSGVAADITVHSLAPVQLPENEIVLTYVPADFYTLAYENIPKGYIPPKTTAITVKDSKEVQHFPLVLLMLGDVNSDIRTNAADAALVLEAASAIGTGGASGLTVDQQNAADVNRDGTFDAVDAALILQHAAYTGSGGTLTLPEFLEQL